MTLGVRAAVLNDRGEVFLIRHTYTPGWHLPGGGVEVGETMVDALVKELREEACISLTGPAPLFGVYLNRKTSPRDHVALYVVRSSRRRHQAARHGDRGGRMVRARGAAAGRDGRDPPTVDEIAAGSAPAAEW